jgi:N-methylhydantoinase A
MVRIANENMANAIRIVTVEEGIDPRDFAILAFGGAGPTHGAELADAIGITRVLVPVAPGLTSAFGTLAAQVRVDHVKSISLVAERTDGATLDALFADLETQARADLEAQGAAETPQLRRSLAMRYQGQNYEQEIPLAEGPVDLEQTVEAYHRLHEDFYGYRFEGIPVELVRATAVALGREPTLPAMAAEETGGEAAERDVFFPAHGFVATPVVRREDVRPAEGPLIVESMDSTVVVPPGWRLDVARDGTLELTK